VHHLQVVIESLVTQYHHTEYKTSENGFFLPVSVKLIKIYRNPVPVNIPCSIAI